MSEVEELRERLAQQEKMASMGILSAGIAHEIQNPLNFVINYAKMSESIVSGINDIINDVKENLDDDDASELTESTNDLRHNLKKIQEQSERAVSIIQSILLMSRGKDGEMLPTDISHLVHEYIALSYHAQRATDRSFNVDIEEDYQPDMPKVSVVPQDLSRAVINVVNNACYALKEKTLREKAKGNNDYMPTLSAKVSIDNANLLITIADNGTGIPVEVQDKLFRETITTKPIGKGTGLGMQIVHDIICNTHHGEVTFETKEGEGTTFIFSIPVK